MPPNVTQPRAGLFPASPAIFRQHAPSQAMTHERILDSLSRPPSPANRPSADVEPPILTALVGADRRELSSRGPSTLACEIVGSGRFELPQGAGPRTQ